MKKKSFLIGITSLFFCSFFLLAHQANAQIQSQFVSVTLGNRAYCPICHQEKSHPPLNDNEKRDVEVEARRIFKKDYGHKPTTGKIVRIAFRHFRSYPRRPEYGYPGRLEIYVQVYYNYIEKK